MAGKYHTSTTDYSGRTVDMLLLQFVSSPAADAVVSPDVSRYPRITAGIEKLVQRFALLFLTQIGTVRLRQKEGTEFMSLLGSGRIYDDSTLRAAAASANREARRQLEDEDRKTHTDDDEAIAASDVTDLRIDRTTATVHVTVTITSKAGESYVYTTPLETGV